MAKGFFKHRLGWEKYLKPFLYKELPPKTGWSATLGTLCALLFVVLAVSGIFLAVYYNPSPDKAHQSIQYIMNDIPGGAILRGIHHWTAGAMVTVVFIHMMVNFFSGTYRAPREFTWIAGAALFVITLVLGFTGYLLPWDMKAYWATTVSAHMPQDLPIIGNFVSKVLLGGDTVSGLTLTRFYAIHTLMLPALLIVLSVFHIYMVRLHGITEDNTLKSNEEAEGLPSSPSDSPQPSPSADAPARHALYRFFPEHMSRSSLVFGIVFAGILLLAMFGTIPHEEVAGTLVENYLPRPEWYYMWLFQLLTYFPGTWEVIGSLGIPIVGCAVLFAVPFFSKNPLHGPSNRPIALAAGTAGVICIVYLTWAAYEGIKPYGEFTPVPTRQLTVNEQRGLVIYNEKECSYCHQIAGRGGIRTGPDMANMVRKNRSVPYLANYIKNPLSVVKSSTMPKYDMSQQDLEALGSFLRALDFSNNAMKTLTRAEILKKSE